MYNIGDLNLRIKNNGDARFRRRRGFSSIVVTNQHLKLSTKTIISLLTLLLFLPVTAHSIGGWETFHIFFRRVVGERSHSQQLHPEQQNGPKSVQERIAPVSNDHVTDDTSADEEGGSKKSGGEGGSAKKRHVGEVTMTSASSTSASSTASTAAFGKGGNAIIARGRRGVVLDEKDLATITFVGRSPFL